MWIETHKMKKTAKPRGKKKHAASGVRQRQRGRERVMTGRVQVSIELVPLPMVEIYAAGPGRKEPNQNPVLPKPMGRIAFSLNPCRMLVSDARCGAGTDLLRAHQPICPHSARTQYDILGPSLCKWLICLMFSTGIFAALATISEGVFANMITPSDRRLKRDILPLGIRSRRGAPLYAYRYKDPIRHGHGVRVGVMAQELLRLGMQDAVVTTEDGFYAVDYARV